MSGVRDEVRDLLDERPELEEPLRSIVAVDRDRETWTFDDVPVDSGQFGELVSRDFVQRDGEEYSLTDREAIVAELDGASTADESSTNVLSLLTVDTDVSLPNVERRFAALFLSVFALVVLFRIIPYPSVFRGDDVVLSANDPYLYRYVVDQLVATSSGPLDGSMLSEMPLSNGEPLLVATLWFVSELFGGASAVGGVLAWYPVVAGLVTAGFVYGIAVRVTADRRVGLAAVGLLAVTPVHAFRTGLGFADHHAFDYVWLALTAWALVALSDREVQDLRGWVIAGLLGFGVAGQTLAWEAGLLLLVPLGLYVVAVVPSAVRAGQSPVERVSLVGIGVAIGAVLSHLVHSGFGWQTTEVAYAPSLLVGIVVGLVIVGEFAHRLDLGMGVLLSIEIACIAVFVVLLPSLLTEFSTSLNTGVEFLIQTEGIAEKQSIFASRLGSIAAPLTLFGLTFFLAVPYLLWVSWTGIRRYAPVWLVPTTYVWFFLGLSFLQIRFAGQLALFIAVFAGFGLLHVLWWVDLATAPVPFQGEMEATGVVDLGAAPDDEGEPVSKERRNLLRSSGVVVATGGLGGLLTPIKHSQITIDWSSYRAMERMRSYASKRGLLYPDNYVFSQWGKSRFYNYLVNGESRSYGYAQSNFKEFLAADDPDMWYRRLSEANRAGFVVASQVAGFNDASGTTYEHLVGDWGERTSHFRVIYADTSRDRKAYILVPGATVTGPGEPGEVVTMSLKADLGDETINLERTVEVNEHGVFITRTPLTGTVPITENDIEVTLGDVERGRLVSGFEGSGVAYWSFEEGSGEMAYDKVGGYHAKLNGVEWSDDGISGGAIRFEGSSEQYAEAEMPDVEEFSLSLWVRPSALDVSDSNDFRDVVQTNVGSLLILEENGRVSFRLPGTDTDRLVAESVTVGEWTHIAATFDGQRRVVYIDGSEQANDVVDVDGNAIGKRIRFGNRFRELAGHSYAGAVDEIRIFSRALTKTDLKKFARQRE